MTIISHEHRFLYLLNPRTASTATADALAKATGAEFLLKKDIKDDKGVSVVRKKHATLRQLLTHGVITPEIAEGYFKFVTVRNPFDSAVSGWAKKVKDYAALADDPKSWVHRVPGYVEGMKRAADSTFADWVLAEYGPLAEAGKQKGMNRPYMRGTDQILRFETLAEDIRAIAPRLGLPGDFSIPVVNVTQGRDSRDYRNYYDERTVDIVSRVFKDEIAQLGYTF